MTLSIAVQYSERSMGVLKKDQKISKRNQSTPPSPGASSAPDSIYEFGNFRLDQRERLLSSNGKPVALAPKVFDILLLLVQRSNSLVEKDTLLNEIWPDSFVEEANLSVNIATLRKALGESTDDHQYIETVPKRGYRFVAPVTRREAEDRSFEEARANLVSVARKPAETKEDLVAANFLAVGNEAAVQAAMVDEELWQTLLRWELALGQEPGAIDAGTHIIAVVRRT